jgi:two-component system CheB/CheR fusion protein
MATQRISEPPSLEMEELRARLEEAEETLRAIRHGEVDALVVTELRGEKVYTLKSADRPYRMMIESMRQGAVTLTLEGVMLYCNAAFAEMLGAPLQSIIGSEVQRFVSAASRDLFQALLRQEGTGQGEAVLLAADGAPLPAYLAFSPLPLDEPGEPVLCMVVTDLTEQKRSERIVADEKLARSILDHAAEVMVVCDTDSRILRANPEAHLLCEKNPLLQPFEEAFPIALVSGEIPDVHTFLERVLAGERLRGIEASLDDGRVDLMLSAGPLWSAEQRIEGCVITLTDITERRRAERELERAWAAAEAMNLAKDHFLATLSHELRTPLTPVLAVISALEDGDRLPAGLLRDVAMVRRNVELEARLIDDLLDLTRVSSGKIRLDRRDVDLREVIEHAVQTSCAEELATGRRRIEVDLAAEDHRLRGDASRLIQVFWNLLNNAVKFTPEQGTITVRSWREAPARIAVEVSDTGVGIEPKVLPRIFDAFEQGEVSVTRRFGGLGLGLAISKAIVELHGGTITVRSEGKGRGTTFTVHLPVGPQLLDTEAPAAAEAPEPEPAAAPIRLRILLVEDHPDTAGALAELMRLHGHEVRVASSIAGALAAAENGGLDLVVSDLGLPDGNGQDLMLQLSRRFGLRGIALSGYGMEEDVRRSREAGFELHLTKPVNLQALESAIQQVAAGEASARS